MNQNTTPQSTWKNGIIESTEEQSAPSDFLEKATLNVPPLYKHQIITAKHLAKHERTLDASDPGTGKTRSHLHAWADRRRQGGGCLLVLAPKTLLEAAWEADLHKYFPGEFRSSVAYAKNRAAAFEADADIYITNVDAVKWLAEKPEKFFNKFDEIIIDEATAFKNRNSKRSKALNKIKKYFERRRALTGTPNSRTVTDVWHQILFLDDGERLGRNFFAFRNSVQSPVQVGPSANMINWIDKPGAEVAVAGLIADITVRHKFEECLDIPEQVMRTMTIHLSKKLQDAYNELKETAVLELTSADVVGINAAVLANKLLQVASGSVYAEGEPQLIDTTRYELTLDLAEEVDHSLVFFMWHHQRKALEVLAKKRGINYEIIDRTVNERRRAEIVKAYQEGVYQTLFLHPKSAAHGLTLTKGTRTIWASPTYEPDIFKQGNHRIYRAGQEHKTEIIMIAAANTMEPQVYAKMQDKNRRMINLLEILQT